MACLDHTRIEILARIAPKPAQRLRTQVPDAVIATRSAVKDLDAVEEFGTRQPADVSDTHADALVASFPA